MLFEEKILAFQTACPKPWLNRMRLNEKMSRHTTFQLGGEASLFIQPESVEEIVFFVQLAQRLDLPFYVIGLGSNLLVSDLGIKGVVLALNRHFSQIKTLTLKDLPLNLQQNTSKTFFVAEAGASLKACSEFALEQGLKSLAFACGIPGSVGGAVYMNAGAYGGEMKEVVLGVEALLPNGTCQYFNQNQLKFAYRYSVFKELENSIVLRVFFALEKGEKNEILDEMKNYTEKRAASQPLELPSAGSMFKRPEGYYAGKLISDAGLKGYRKGSVGVSEKHAGFVVQYGGAKTEEVIELVHEIQAEVKKKFGVCLEPEVRFVGEGEKPWN